MMMIKGTKEKDLVYRNCQTSGWHVEWEIPMAYGFLQPSPSFVFIEEGAARRALLAVETESQKGTVFKVVFGDFTPSYR